MAGAIGGRMQSAVSEAVQSVLEDRHLHFDMKVRDSVVGWIGGWLVAGTGASMSWKFVVLNC